MELNPKGRSPVGGVEPTWANRPVRACVAFRRCYRIIHLPHLVLSGRLLCRKKLRGNGIWLTAWTASGIFQRSCSSWSWGWRPVNGHKHKPIRGWDNFTFGSGSFFLELQIRPSSTRATWFQRLRFASADCIEQSGQSYYVVSVIPFFSVAFSRRYNVFYIF